MARGSWQRDPDTGIPLKRLPEDYVDVEGRFKWRAVPDCDVAGTPRVLRDALGLTMDPRDFERRVLTDPSSPFHLHPLKCGAEIIGWATHTDSLHAGWANYQRGAEDRQKAGKPRTNPSSGTALPPDAITAKAKG